MVLGFSIDSNFSKIVFKFINLETYLLIHKAFKTGLLPGCSRVARITSGCEI